MIGDEHPSETKGFRLGDDITQPFNKIIPVLIIFKFLGVKKTNCKVEQHKEIKRFRFRIIRIAR
jgi:hypothetical protein